MKTRWVLLPMFSLCLVTPAFAEDTCELAATLAEKGAKTFASNKAEGLKLLIKAKELCPSDPAYAYNLGAAYYQYGRIDDALPLLQEAVAKQGSNSIWLNNLAVALLYKGATVEALPLAEKAVKLAADNAEMQETVARARFASGKEIAALQGLATAQQKKSESKLAQAYTSLLDQYLARQLEALQAGKTESGLAGLKAADFDPQANRALVLALAKLGRSEEALSAADTAVSRFDGEKSSFPVGDIFDSVAAEELLKKTRDEVGNQVALALYSEFQQGGGAKTVQRAKTLAKLYPASAPLKTAADKLVDALIADATTITVPDEVARAAAPKGSGGLSEALLAGLGTSTAGGGEVDLSVDIDQNIPAGQAAGRDDVAVVIGNKNYGVAGTPNVDYALRDAQVMRQYLEKTLGFDPKNILYVENATYAGFAQLFGREGDARGKLSNYVVPGKSQVFVYYVGHGAPDPESGDAYFVPVDADPQFLKSSGYRLQTFYDNLAKLPSKSTTVVLDSCFSGNSAGGLLFKGVSSISLKAKAVAAPQQMTVFASSRDDQMSNWYEEKRHSLYTYYFLKGLGGEADANRDRKVTVAEMEDFLNDNVPRMARRLKGAEQAPQTSGERGRVLVVLK